MSCITEILKRKEVDPILVPDLVYIESGGEYKNYEYLVTFNTVGHRGGYVAVPRNHPHYKKQYDTLRHLLDVHGGVEFFSKSKRAEVYLGHPCPEKWVGFSAGHIFDARDIECTKKYFPNDPLSRCPEIEDAWSRLKRKTVLRTNEFMENECKRLIDQLIVAEKVV